MRHLTPMRLVLLAVLCTFLPLLALAQTASTPATAKAPKLVITKAVYGDLPSGEKIDATKKLNELVKDNALSVDATNDVFGDPAEGVFKKLEVKFTIDGVAGVKTVNENETLTLSLADKPFSGKIVITKAVYGDLPDGEKVDATAKVTEMVKAGTYAIPATNDNFTDPAVGVGKKLKIDYTLDGVAKSQTVDENETLQLVLQK